MAIDQATQAIEHRLVDVGGGLDERIERGLAVFGEDLRRQPIGEPLLELGLAERSGIAPSEAVLLSGEQPLPVQAIERRHDRRVRALAFAGEEIANVARGDGLVRPHYVHHGGLELAKRLGALISRHISRSTPATYYGQS